MKFTIAPHHLETLHHHLEAAYPQEGCGLMLGTLENTTFQIHQIIPTTNVWNHPEDAFEACAIAMKSILEKC